MPIYEYICPKCGHEIDTYLRLEDYDAPIYCHSCYDNGDGHVQMNKRVSKISMVTSTKYKEIEREAERNGNIIKEPGLAEDAKRNRGYKEQHMRKEIRKSIEKTVSEFSI